jgi:aminopeptidase YwaD
MLGIAQNKEFAKQAIEKLCSEDYSGRGYVNEGDKKAARFIADAFRRFRLGSPNIDYYQSFGFPVITFPGETFCNADGVGLEPGRDFIVNAGCPPIKGKFNIIYIDSATIDNNFAYEIFKKQGFRKSFIVVSDIQKKTFLHPERAEEILKNKVKAKGLIIDKQDKFTWSVATEKAEFPILYIQKKAIKHTMIEMDINIESIPVNHQTQNVIGISKGRLYPDSFIVFTAHYDHLGMFGPAMFPGANDNASGIAMMLDMASYISKNPLDYSVAFIAFAGEEAGLLGSYYFTQNPLIPLQKMALLINMDLMATGDKGLTAVNGSVFPDEFKLLQFINEQGNYLPNINIRGKAQNSDHYFFTEAGVKSFFFYLMGDYHFYHDIDDTAKAVTLSKYEEAYRLIFDFTQAYIKSSINNAKK